jgi:hypothetical protein
MKSLIKKQLTIILSIIAILATLGTAIKSAAYNDTSKNEFEEFNDAEEAYIFLAGGGDYTSGVAGLYICEAKCGFNGYKYVSGTSTTQARAYAIMYNKCGRDDLWDISGSATRASPYIACKSVSK